jgi:protein-S-isoprenylcysteine O-methyltransferase Ste14
VTSAALYALLVVVLVVRVRSTDDPLPEPMRPAPGEPLWLTTAHHVLLAVVLLGAPVERALLGGAASGRGPGAVLFAAGVVLYRVAGRALGDALSPFTEPRAGAALVTGGPYAMLRHPMYASQALVAVGAPLFLGARWMLLPAALDLVVLGLRAVREDDALARTFPEYSRYAARTKRVLPYIY